MSMLAIFRNELHGWPRQVSTAVNGILDSEPFLRLKQVAFLGAIDYMDTDPEHLPADRSRHDHSLGVALLASRVARARGYDADTAQHAISAALLHDIGHIPLSHSAESVARHLHGLDHHRLGLGVIRGTWPDAERLGRWLRQHHDMAWLEGLYRAEPEWPAGDLFAHVMNLDTLDGITRTARLYARGTHGDVMDAWTVAQAVFVDHARSSMVIQDRFWRLKDRIYHDVIHSPAGVWADLLAQDHGQDILADDSSGLRQSDRTWYQRKPDLFAQLKTGLRERPRGELRWTARQYLVQEEEQDVCKRYQLKKYPAYLSEEDVQAYWQRMESEQDARGEGRVEGI